MGLLFAVIVAQAASPAVEASSTRFEQKLHLNDDQVKALRAYEALGDPDGKRAAELAEEFKIVPKTMPELLNWREKIEVENLGTLRKVRVAAQIFYNSLSPDQRVMFDQNYFPTENPMHPLPSSPPDESGVAKTHIDPLAPRETEATWAEAVNGDVISDFYPSVAMKKNITGHSSVECTVTISGLAKDCEIQSERPTGLGFGNAELESMAFFRFKPATRYGVPVVGNVTIPINWQLEADAPPIDGPKRSPETSPSPTPPASRP